MQIKRADGDLHEQIAPGGTDLLLTGRFQVRVLARELKVLLQAAAPVVRSQVRYLVNPFSWSA